MTDRPVTSRGGAALPGASGTDTAPTESTANAVREEAWSAAVGALLVEVHSAAKLVHCVCSEAASTEPGASASLATSGDEAGDLVSTSTKFKEAIAALKAAEQEAVATQNTASTEGHGA